MRSWIVIAACSLMAALPVAAQVPGRAEPHRFQPQAQIPRNTTPRAMDRRMTIPPSRQGRWSPLTERRWNQGRWYHGSHNGRVGWWWTIGPDFFFYNAPVYPRPRVYGPNGAAPGFWYWCDAYQNYYPYVTYCPSGWRPLPPR